MPADKPTELSRIKLKTWTRQPFPMVSKHSAHSTSLPVGFRTWFWRYTCFLLLISMLWHRQAILESKGDKLSSSAECRIRTQGLRHLFANRLNACWQTDWAIEDQAKNLHSGSTILSDSHPPFVPCQSTLLFLGYGYFTIWYWKSKVKVMAEVKIQSHKVGPTSYLLPLPSFYVNRPSKTRDTIVFFFFFFFQNVTLEIQVQGHSSRSHSGFSIQSTHTRFVPCK